MAKISTNSASTFFRKSELLNQRVVELPRFHRGVEALVEDHEWNAIEQTEEKRRRIRAALLDRPHVGCETVIDGGLAIDYPVPFRRR